MLWNSQTWMQGGQRERFNDKRFDSGANPTYAVSSPSFSRPFHALVSHATMLMLHAPRCTQFSADYTRHYPAPACLIITRAVVPVMSVVGPKYPRVLLPDLAQDLALRRPSTRGLRQPSVRQVSISARLGRATLRAYAARPNAPLAPHLLHVIPILAGVALLPPKVLEERVECAGQHRSHARAKHVDPEVARELPVDHSRAKRAGWVERTTRKVDAYS